MSNEAPHHPTARAARVTVCPGGRILPVPRDAGLDSPLRKPRHEVEATVIAFQVPEGQMPQVVDDDSIDGWSGHHGDDGVYRYTGVVTVEAGRRLAAEILAACDDAEKL